MTPGEIYAEGGPRRLYVWEHWYGSGPFRPQYVGGGRRRLYVGVCSHFTAWQIRYNGRKWHWYWVLRGTWVERLIAKKRQPM